MCSACAAYTSTEERMRRGRPQHARMYARNGTGDYIHGDSIEACYMYHRGCYMHGMHAQYVAHVHRGCYMHGMHAQYVAHMQCMCSACAVCEPPRRLLRRGSPGCLSWSGPYLLTEERKPGLRELARSLLTYLLTY